MTGLVWLILAGCPGPEAEPVLTSETVAQEELAPAGRVEGRDLKRMNVEQLAEAISLATGGLAWTDAEGTDILQELHATLGAPDYLFITQEDLSVSIVFEKFLGDAAAAVCTELLEREAAGEQRVFLVDAGPEDTWEGDSEAIEANLRRQLLRFHGQRLDAGHPELEPWTELWRGVHDATGDPVAAWRALCVGLIRHPDFATY